MRIDEAANKQSRIDALVDSGLSRSDALLVEDLCEHAVKEAIAALDRVADTAPQRLRPFIHMSAMMTLKVNIAEALRITMEAMLTGRSPREIFDER